MIQASKFDPENDLDRPKLNSIIEFEGNQYNVLKVDYITMSEIIKGDRNPDEENTEYDKLIVKNHINRPAVYWLMWGNKL